MRPIKLIISAFGPYAGEVQIEFDKFLDKGIYLISGNTGAGKSTIFEAIRFALYGEDSGEARSKYASDNVPTYVSMTFLLRGKEYKVTRNPKYLRPKKSGEGSVLAKPEAELVYPDGKVVSGYSNVTKEINVLTGLNSEQFSKIVMIAQGKFRELLVADTASRSKIFRDIFKTEPYDKIQRKVKNKYLEVYKENSKTNDSIKQYVQGIKVNEHFDKKNRLENISNQDIITDIDEVLDLVNELIKLDEKLYEDNNAIIGKMNDEIQTKSSEVTEDKKIIANMEALRIEFNKLMHYESVNDSILAEYEQENNLKPIREQLLVELEQEKIVVEKYKQYEHLISSLDKAVRAEENIQKEVVKLTEEKEDIKNKIADIEKKTQIKLIKEKELISLENSIKETEENFKKLDKIEQYHKRLAAGEKDYKQKLDAFKEKEILCENAKNEYNESFNMLIKAQAGLMAEELQKNPNSPCPVCGSTVHVNLAKVITGAPTETEVNKLRVRYDVATNEVMEASNDAGRANNAINNEKTNLLEAIKEVDDSWTLDNYIENKEKSIVETSERLRRLSEQRDILVGEVKLLSKDLEECANVNAILEGIESKLKDKESSLTVSKLEIKTIETNIENIKVQLKTDNEFEARESLRLKEEKYKGMVEAYERSVVRYNEHMTNQTKSRALVNQLASQIKDINCEEMTEDGLAIQKDNLLSKMNENNILLEQLNNSRQEVITVNNEVYSRIQSNKDVVNKLSEQKSNLGHISKRLSSLKVLSDTLNGEMEGKDKIKLETFVQISYFEQVILKANTKLFEMTEGQYEFIRDVSSEDKRSKSGLELSVYDHYNGTIRSVKTLSGGEGFKAALSLALGMADIIEESASGISIDTMFIDEGFGSLDEMALEQAMKVLAKLSEGNKLVGIISHVSSLKDRIEKQICVEKNMSGGSNVKVIV